MAMGRGKGERFGRGTTQQTLLTYEGRTEKDVTKGEEVAEITQTNCPGSIDVGKTLAFFSGGGK